MLEAGKLKKMDVSFLAEDNFSLTYVSCIEIDGCPILAPVMTESKRAEMRKYREIAIAREKNRKAERERENEVRMSLENSPMEEETFSNNNLSSTDGELNSSTGCESSQYNTFIMTKKRQALQRGLNLSLSHDSGSFTNISDDGIQPQPRCTADQMDGNIINKSKVQMSKLDSSESSSSSDEGGGHFASIGSSTGTFIVQSGRKHFDEQNLSELTDEDENKENELELLNRSPDHLSKGIFSKNLSLIHSKEAILFGEREASYKRKRPASYFDSENSAISGTITTSTPESESTNLSKYITAVNSHSSNATITPSDLDMMAVNKTFTPTPLIETFSVGKNSPVINTDFGAAAVAMGHHKNSPTPKRFEDAEPLTSTVRRRNLFESPSPRLFAKDKLGYSDKTSPEDDILSTDVPSSAEKSPPEKLTLHAEKEIQEIASSDCDNSDKENNSFKKKHVRKLSYTLLTPCAELLAASKRIGPVPLEPLMSAPSSVGIPSVNATPEKPKHENKVEQSQTPTSQELDARLDNLNHAMHKLQQLNLGKGKKAHLERFLGDQRVVEQQNQFQEEERMNDKKEEHQSLPEDTDVELRFRKLQEQHEKQLAILAEMHRQQQIKMTQQFAQEKEKILLELKNLNAIGTYNTNAPKENDVFPSSPSYKSNFTSKDSKNNEFTNQNNCFDYEVGTSLKVIGSGIAPITHTGHSAFETRSQLANSPQVSSKSDCTSARGRSVDESPPIVSASSHGGFSNLYGGLSNQNIIISTPTPEPWGYVGLSKLQARMQALSPSYFKSPADTKSPILKGLIYLDPLNKPKGPIKIPAQVSDPLLKVKFEKVTAAVKGYLTRRLLHTEKIQLLIQTIRDTVALVLRLHEEAPGEHANTFMVRPQDAELHRRLFQQLGGACNSFHEVFFKLSPTERMAIIATDREKLKAKAMKNLMTNSNNNTTAHKRNISVATLKCLERRLSITRSASKKDSSIKKARSSIPFQGSQSVKPKVIASYKISPKRRRMSYFDRDQMISNRVTKPGRLSSSSASTDMSRNRWRSSITTKKTSYNQNAHSSRSDTNVGLRSSVTNTNLRSSRSNQETFLVASSISSSRSRPPTGSSQFTDSKYSVDQASSHRGILRVPWK